MNTKLTIRIATSEDAEALLHIYAPYVTDTAISFEYEVPALDAFRGRIEQVQKQFPYLVAESDGQIVGYAYATPFKPRAAYDWAVETSVYVDRSKKRMGIGKALYRALEQALQLQGVLNMNACIAQPSAEDGHLTQGSVRFHEHLGYSLVGEFHQCGYKFHTWYNMVWMEKHIGAHHSNQPKVQPFDAIRGSLFAQYGIK